MYFAIIGDIIDSRKILHRNEVQMQMQQVLNNVNDTYKEYIASNFTITLGDEFQGLLSNASKIFEIIDYIRYSLYPINLRLGIGIGDMSTRFQRTTSIGSDGPAYWAARQAINTIHNDDNKSSLIRVEADLSKGMSNQDLDVAMQETLTQTIGVINSTLVVCQQQEASWTHLQADFVAMLIKAFKYGDNGKFVQVKIAKEFHLSPQMVSNKMKMTGVKKYIAVRINLSNIVQNICNKA